MRIYLTHATHGYDFSRYLYSPIKASTLAKAHTIIYPHERDYGNEPQNNKSEIHRASLVIAEVSHAAIGTGIELGWAEEARIPVLALYEHGGDYSRSILLITHDIHSYSGGDEMVQKIQAFIASNSNLH